MVEANQDLLEKQEELQSRLEELESKFQTIVEGALVGVYVLQGGKFVYYNSRMLEMGGWTAEEVNTWSPMDFLNTIHPDDREDLKQRYLQREAQKGEEFVPSEYRIIRKDGKIRWIFGMHQGTTFLGKPATIGSVMDITDKKKTQMELEKERLQRNRMQAIEILAGGIAHDFNNLLLNILGSASLLTEEIKSPKHSQAGSALELVDQIERSALAAATITKQLLSFTRGSPPTRELISIPQLVQDTRMLVPIGAGIEFREQYEPNLAKVCVNPGQITQVLTNLFLNAIQAMPDGGMLRVEAREVNTNGRKLVETKISDTGIGIPAEHREKIFTPYFSTKASHGLGLASVYYILTNHHGSISVESEVGVGTTFTFTLPVEETLG